MDEKVGQRHGGFKSAQEVFTFLLEKKVIGNKNTENEISPKCKRERDMVSDTHNASGKKYQRDPSNALNSNRDNGENMCSVIKNHVPKIRETSEEECDSNTDEDTISAFVSPSEHESNEDDFVAVGLLIRTPIKSNLNCQENSSPSTGPYGFDSHRSDTSSPEHFQKTKRPKLSKGQRLARDERNHPIGASCACHRKCLEKITQGRRLEIHRSFWEMDYSCRKRWLSERIVRKPVDRHRLRKGYKSKTESRCFTFPNDDGEHVQVCREFFIKTLGYKHDTFITTLCKTTVRGSVTPPPDRRGRHSPGIKLAEKTMTIVDQHIESYNPSISHYRRKHAPNCRYLPPELTAVAMYADLKEKHPNMTCSIDTYKRTLREKKISFAKLGVERCEVCMAHDIDEQSQTEQDLSLDEWRIHINEARLSRQQYQVDGKAAEAEADCKTTYLSCDMQKVLLLPRLPGVKSCLFVRRLVVFHETFAPIGGKKKTVSCLWGENTAGRNAAQIASCFEEAFNCYEKTERFVIWADNCAAQNKNWTLFTCLVQLVNSAETSFEEIEMRYLEKGHTFMAADACHARVEKSLRRTKNSFTLTDIAKAIKESGGHPTVLEMQPSHFRQWQNGINKHKTCQRPYLNSIRMAKFTRGSTKLHFKCSWESKDFKSCDFLREDIVLTELPVKCTSERGIPAEKKRNIIRMLGNMMPESKRPFWDTMSESETSADLLQQQEQDDENMDDNIPATKKQRASSCETHASTLSGQLKSYTKIQETSSTKIHASTSSSQLECQSTTDLLQHRREVDDETKNNLSVPATKTTRVSSSKETHFSKWRSHLESEPLTYLPQCLKKVDETSMGDFSLSVAKTRSSMETHAISKTCAKNIFSLPSRNPVYGQLSKSFELSTTASLTTDASVQSFSKLLNLLGSCPDFSSFKTSALQFEKHLLPLRVRQLSVHSRPTDKPSLQLYPSDGPFMTPLAVYGDGNCLPRCGSLLVYGTEEHHLEIRARIVLELACNSEHYLGSCESHFCAQYSEHYMGDTLTLENIQRIFQCEVMEACRPSTYMGLWELQALASVLHCPIFSIYPEYGGYTVRNHLHRIIQPRCEEKQNTYTPGILWTHTQGANLPAKVWRPNHFVVCLP